MSVADLKKFLERKGVPCKDCVQKEDFVEIAISVQDHSDVESSKKTYFCYFSEVILEESERTTESASLNGKDSEPVKKEAKDLILEHLNYFTAAAIKNGQEYSVKAHALALEFFNQVAEFSAESAKVYGPKAQELFKVYSALLKEHGVRHGEWAVKQANIYAELGLRHGKALSMQALQKFQELGQTAMDHVDKILEERREKSKKEL